MVVDIGGEVEGKEATGEGKWGFDENDVLRFESCKDTPRGAVASCTGN